MLDGVLGYGWDDQETCTAAFQQRPLVEHVDKGDPVDVANSAMMLRDFSPP